ncbi:MAG: DegV family protein [Erysipelotrichaceae bacterium]|nr:DegV family protein [Erysipelotrichaceae bacterium]
MINNNNANISGKEVYGWFSLGLSEVQMNRKYLNSINLFPIADGDTGSNMAMTIRAMVETVNQKASFSETIRLLAKAGLANARGNSGILFVSYFNGMANETNGNESLTISEFADIAHKAVSYVYNAIENPVEGTMITVIREWADYLHNNRLNYDSVLELFNDAYQTAKKALANTAQQLQIHKKNHQVDAGAQGFVHFLHGINRYYTNEAIEIIKPVDKKFIDNHHESYQYRYCTEVYLRFNKRYNKFDEKRLTDQVKEQLSDMGDSLIVSINDGYIRIHIHVNDPRLLVKKMKEYGTFIEQKADDMFLQLDVQQNRRSKIGLITDTIADIPDELKSKYQIFTIPLGMIIEDEVYLDKLTINSEDVFGVIDNGGHPTSTQPEPIRVKNILEEIADRYDSLIVISVASKLSGTFNVIKKEADALNENGYKISVIDSKLNSGAQGLLVKKAAELISEGLQHEELVQKLNELASKGKIYVCLNTLDYAVAGGRVPDTVGKIGKLFKMRPIMSLDKEGKGIAFGIGFSQESMTKKIYRLVKKTLKRKGIMSYSIVHSSNDELANQYITDLTDMIGKGPEFVSNISAIVAMHSGPGCVAVSFINERS